ncbi:lytic transglycosylase domain-containing protein [Pseudofrankia sp. DC12]|uniref:lytic transglycosylase domain-containing protein n=1 Tax=Pseudofrankia sp. DC12 TaxID=683315 RepID=UPI000697B19E|nr:lytic transglycosylase domain-containing protein [Pseudofrankia sp. DC12]
MTNVRRRTRPTTGASAVPPANTPSLEAAPADAHARGDAEPIRDQEPLIDTVDACPGDLPGDGTPPQTADPPPPAAPRTLQRRHRKTKNKTSSRHVSPNTSGKPPGRHRKPPAPDKKQSIRRAQVIGLPLLGLPAIILLLVFTVAPSGDTAATSRTTPPTTATSYPMPTLNPAGPATGDDGQPPTGALATAAANPTSAPSLVTLTAADRRIPAPVLAAYQQAATTLTSEQPGCRLRWQLLAGIGKVESGNATGRQISPDGTVSPTILGPRLTGGGGFARILDTDRGALDGDTAYDRAVGPLQFLPSTWSGAGRDGNADGHRDPNNIHDAALAAGGYLCAHHRDLANPTQLTAAIRAYNPSDAYVRAVLAWTTGYTTTPTPITPPTGGTAPAGGDTPTADPYPVFALTPIGTATPSGSPAAAACAPVTITTGSLTAALIATALNLTGRYTTPATETNSDGTITVHTVARNPDGQTLADTDRPLPLKTSDLPTLLTQLPLDQLTTPGHTTTITLTLTSTPPGCPTQTLATLTITNITRPAGTPTPTGPATTSTPAPTPTPTPSTSSIPTASPTLSTSPHPTTSPTTTTTP